MKENIENIENSTKEVMLIEPKNVTYANIKVTDWQMDAITLIMDRLQQNISCNRDSAISHTNLRLVIKYSDFGISIRNKSILQNELSKLAGIVCKFKWYKEELDNKQTIKTTVASLISQATITNGCDDIEIDINPWAIPFLLYYGVNVGGTHYNKKTLINLKGGNIKRLYKFCCANRHLVDHYFDYSLDRFRLDFNLSEKYTASNIKCKILVPAQDAIKVSNSDIYFKYEFLTKSRIRKTKASFDTIRFYFHLTEDIILDSNYEEVKIDNLFNSSIQVEFYPLITKWLEYKKQRKEKFEGEIAINAFYNKLLKLSNSDIEIATAIIEQSFSEGFPTIYELQTTPQKSAPRGDSKSTLNNSEATEAELKRLLTAYPALQL